MRLEGWIFLILSWGAIVWVTVFSFRKVLQKKKRKKRGPIHSK